MADLDIAIRGTVRTATSVGDTRSVTSDPAEVGDYVLLLGATNYQSSLAPAAPPAGLDAWVQCVYANDANTQIFGAWLARVTTAGQKTVTLTTPGSASNIDVAAAVLNPASGTITVDGATNTIDRSSPFAHTAIGPAGTKDMLVAGFSVVQFSGTTAFGAAPSGMTQRAAIYNNSATGFQVCTQTLTAAGSTGSRSQTASPTSQSGGAGAMFALRSQGSATVDHPAAASLSGGGQLTTGAAQAHRAAATLSGGGALAAGAVTVRPAAATLSGGGAVAATAGVTRPAAASLTGGGSLAVTAGPVAAAALTGGGELTTTPLQTHTAAAALTGGGQLAATASQDHRAGAALSGGGALAAAATRVHPGAVTLTGGGQLAVTGTRVKIGAAALSGGGELTIGDVLRTAVVAAQLDGGGQLTARAAVHAGGGLNLSVWAVDRTQGGKLIPLPGVVSGDVSDIANEPGAITITHLTDGTRGDQLLRRDVGDDSDLEVEIWTGGRRSTALRGYLDSVEGDDVAEHGARTYIGSLMLIRLAQAVIAEQPADEKLEYRVDAATPGEMALQLLAQCQARGVLTDITADFTATHDSEGAPWPELFTGKWSPGTTLLDWVQSLVDLVLCETELTAAKVWRLFVFGGRGGDRTGGLRPVTLRRGLNLGEAGRRATVRGAGTDFLVAAGEGNYRRETVPNARARRGRAVEVSTSVGTIDDPTALIAAAQRVAAAGTSGATERSFALSLTAGQPRPVQSFVVGDTVRVDTAGQLGPERVAQWQLAWDPGGVTGSAMTGDLIRSRMAGLLRRLNAVGSGTAIIGTSEPREDTGVPLAPTGLVVGSAAFLEGQDVYASVTAGWNPVQSNTDGTAATDLAGYRVEWALEASPDTWNLAADVSDLDTDASWSTAPGTPIRVRVQAYDRSGNRSAWSNTVQHLTEDDATPPPVASAPVVANWLGALRITWDGLSMAGLAMAAAAPDFSHVELHLSTASNFAPDPAAWPTGTLVTNLYAGGTWTIGDLPIGVTHYARLVAVDTRDNRADPSAQGSDTPRQLLGPEIFEGAVGSAQLADLAVIGAKIADLAVNNAKVADLSVAKLTAGTMSADVLIAGIFRTALTGARTETDNAGYRLYDPNNALRVQFKTSDGSALVTGEYRSALSGRRFVINPGGSIPDEIRFYRSGGLTNYGRIRSIDTGDGTGLNIRSGTPSGWRSAELLVTMNTASLLHGDIENGVHRSRIIVDDRHSYVSSPVVDISADTRYPADGNATGHRISFFHLGSNGLLIENSLIEMRPGPSQYEPWMKASFRDCGIIFGNEAGSNRGMLCVVNNSAGWQQISAAQFNTISGRAAKEDVRDARAVLDPLQTIRAARARAYTLRSQKWHQPGSPPGEPDPPPIPVEAPTHVGVIAEDLPDVLVKRTDVGIGDTNMMIDLGSQIGVLWGALGQVCDQEIRTVVGRTTLVAGGPFMAGTERDLPVTWDEPPLEVPTGGVVTVHAGVAWMGKATAVIVPGTLTETGCTVRARFLATVAPTAGQPLTFEPQGLYLWTPPYEQEIP